MLDLNDNHPDDVLIEKARMAVSSEWEVEFIHSILVSRKQYGLNFELTTAQRDSLEKIAGL